MWEENEFVKKCRFRHQDIDEPILGSCYHPSLGVSCICCEETHDMVKVSIEKIIKEWAV